MPIAHSPVFDVLRALLAKRVLILDGAMGTMIQRLHLSEAGWRGERFKDHPTDLAGNSDALTLSRPDLISAIHHQYLAAGADLIETNTFNATAISQRAYGLETLVYEMNLEAATLARAAADAWTTPGRPRFVAGAIGPMSRNLSIVADVNHPAMTFDQCQAAYEAQVRGLIDGGADVLLLETIVDLRNAEAAMAATEKVFEAQGVRLPLMISITIVDRGGRILSGQTLEAFYAAVRHARPFSVGINCAPGARDMRPYLAELAGLADGYVSCYPNAGLPNANGEYEQGPFELRQLLRDLVAGGLAHIVGGCCGTTPEHVAAIVEAVEGVTPRAVSGTGVPPDREATGATTARAPEERALLSYDNARANRLQIDWDDQVINSPWFLGRRPVEEPLANLVPYIDWASLFTTWNPPAPFPAILDHPQHGAAARARYDNARTLLERIVKERLLTARGVYGFWPANSEVDDIVVYRDDSRRSVLARLPMLRQQAIVEGDEPHRSLADFIAPRDSGVPDYLGMFAVSAGIGAEELAHRLEREQRADDATMVEALAELLSGAFAEALHAQARKDWGYERNTPAAAELLAGKFQGIRTAYGDPACPDPSEAYKLFEILGAASQGIALTEPAAPRPATTVSGLYFSPPQATHFDIGPIGPDQAEDYARRKGGDPEP